VEILLFPVKLGPPSRAVLAALVALQAPACGYRSAILVPSYAGRLAAVAAPFSTPHPEAAAAAMFGAREELSSAGLLGGQTAYPRLVIEIVRVDELPAGIAAPGAGGPLGRGSDIGVTAHGWIEESAGAAPSHDTGDVRRVETVAQGSDAVAASVSADEAIRSAAREAGRAVARRAIGLAEPAVEPM
jgi:hypothetical protein